MIGRLVQLQDNFTPDRFHGQVALVVGGAQGIGRAIAMRLAREGASVIIADIDGSMMKQTAKEILKAGGKVTTSVCDVRQRSQVERVVQRVIAREKQVDILMYVAGVGKGATVHQDRREALGLDPGH